MVNSDLIKKDRYDEIERLSREAVSAMIDLKVSKVVSPCGGQLKAPLLAGVLAADGDDAEPGYIELTTTSVKRAVYHLKKQGVEVEEVGAEVFLKEKAGGLAVKLKEK